MIKVKNYTATDITIDNVLIPSFGEVLFTSFTNTLTVNRLINQGKISVLYIGGSLEAQNISKDVVNKTMEIPKVQSIPTVEKQTDSIKSNIKRKKLKDIDTVMEKSNSEKGDIKNATD